MIPRKRNTYYKGQLRDAIFGFRPRLLKRDGITGDFEKVFAKKFGFSNAVATCTGRDGLLLLLNALGIKAGDEIITPAYTLGELVVLLKERGYVPVLADVDEATYQVTAKSIEPRITEKTRAILATHLFGWPCDIENIVELARSKNILVIEDCAHALGGRLSGRALGSFGDGAFFSLEQVKPVNTFGGGLVVAKNPSVVEQIRKGIEQRPDVGIGFLRQVITKIFIDFAVRSPFWRLASWFFASNLTRRLAEKTVARFYSVGRVGEVKYSDYQAMMGIKAIEYLSERNKRLNQLVKIYRENLPDAVKIQPEDSEVQPAYFMLVTRTPYEAIRVKAAMLKHGVGVGAGSEITDDCSKIMDADCPNASLIYRMAIQLPLHPAMRESEVMKVCSALKKVIY